MQSPSFFDLCRRWNQAEVRYLVVGGFAVIAHGYLRTTQDVDVVLEFDPKPMARAMQVLEDLDFRPRVPVPLRAFADPVQREQWIQEKDMLVFTVWRNAEPFPDEVDLFVKHPFDFERAWSDAFRTKISDGTVITFIDRQRLLQMKREAGRPKDLADLSELERLS